MRRLFIDFESFFGSVKLPNGKTMSLSLKNPKLNYTDYVRHPEFEVLGASLQWEDEDGPTFYRGNELPGVFQAIDWGDTEVVAHNALFDGLILFEVFGIVPARYFCTLAAAEFVYQGAYASSLDALAKALALGEKLPDLDSFRNLHARDLTEAQWEILARYANNDATLLRGIYRALAPGLPADEKELMSLTIMLFCDPIMVVDKQMAEEALHDAEEERDRLVLATGLTQGEISGNISFEKALTAALAKHGEDIPRKTNAKGILTPAFAKTDLDFVSLKSHKDPHVRALVEARLEVKSSLSITRAQRLLAMANYGRGLLNICLNFARAHTLRWTGGNKMNPQNFTRGSKLRLAMRAPAGHKLVVVDSSQIEARVLAVLAGQDDLVQTFATGGDPYAEMATKVYGYVVTKLTHVIERFMGKTMVLGLGYGMGWRKFFNEIRTGARGMALEIEPEFAQRAVMIYRDANGRIMAFHKTAESWLGYLANDSNPRKKVLEGLVELDPKTRRVLFPNGCYLRYPGLINDEGEFRYRAWNDKTKRHEWKKIYGGAFVENLVQAVARHIVAHQILQISKRYRCVLFVHDECVFIVKDITPYRVPTAVMEEALEFAMAEFRKKPPWFPYDIPLDSEGGYDISYSK